MALPLVSIVITTYRRPELLARSINSILNQTYSNVEVIVVDDNDPVSDYRKKTEMEGNVCTTTSQFEAVCGTE